MNDLREALRTALITRFGADRDALDEDTALFSSGLIDSLGVMEFVSVVEREIGQAIPPEAITLENFDTIARVLAFAQGLQGAGSRR